MLAYVPAAFFLVLLVVGVLRDRRRFGNAVLFGLFCVGLAFGLLHAAVVGVGGGHHALEWAVAGILLLPLLGALVLPVFLLSNGVKMIRKEGRRPANLLSFLAGLALVGLLALALAAVATRSPELVIVAGTALLLAGYVSFLFFCFLAYALLYGWLRPRRDVDFVVVLGCGLVGGSRVPPLLAGRLERARRLYAAQAARGRPPVLVVSGGQGPDEKVPEAHAMAVWLVEHGVPAEHVLREARSRTTTENLLFSRAVMEAARPGYRCLVVTSNYHAFRAALTARRTGVNGQVVGARTAAYFWPSATIREFVAVFFEHKLVNLTVCVTIVFLGAGAWWRR
ncbi:YdcF family protein [Streptomyces mashuensis]|uniref:YdcF family protein n=1 Tax=Streptomyces mashuensis TaxID=33904 RepID=UPI00167D9518|nr:YdcF family protein [Streptomyces mashuensis]